VHQFFGLFFERQQQKCRERVAADGPDLYFVSDGERQMHELTDASGCSTFDLDVVAFSA
jgi:hypothetical protein